MITFLPLICVWDIFELILLAKVQEILDLFKFFERL